MINVFEKNLISLAKSLSSPLYAVGGVVRNYLIDGSVADDIDLCAGVREEELLPLLEKFNFTILGEYKRTGTILFSGQRKYEFTCFRKEKYNDGGEHTPYHTEFTLDINEDAKRRDFKCNAVYYDIANQKFVDVLGGIEDIKNKVLDTVIQPDKVFCNDGLRLMRLARFCGELNFTPTIEVLESAKKYARNITAISSERIQVELKKILESDKKYAFSDRHGHYTGMKVLDQTGVLDCIIPELTAGRGMAQRADFHKYDVLEHSLKSVKYAHRSVRLAALLHDVGKPYCFIKTGKYHYHEEEGRWIAERVLKRLKFDKKTIEEIKYLIFNHMIDLDCKMSESKLRYFIAKQGAELKKLIYIKQADFRASLDDNQPSPTLLKWKKLIKKMQLEGAPRSIKELKINAKSLIALGYTGKQIGDKLEELFKLAVLDGKNNSREKLLKKAKIKQK